MRSLFSRLGVLLAIFVAGCAIEHPTERDAGACGLVGTPCCNLDAGIRLDASGLSASGCGAGLSCVAGAGGQRLCQACPSGQQLCNGACVDVTSNSHCGACGNACAAGFSCITGNGDAGAPSCERVCPPGQNRCGSGASGICTNLNSDAQNCGTCGTNCTARMLPNVTVAACSMGSCAVGTCAANFANCDMNAANGCETNTQSSVMHCGGCGRTCNTPPNAVPVCRGGSCDFTCMAGFSDCDRNPTNGCETNLNTDANNCMTCGNRCPALPGQTATCRAGVCGTTMTLMCPGDRGDCNAMAGDGCETNLLAGTAGPMMTINHCGACGRTCSFSNAPAQCLAGQCVIGTCIGNARNCNGDQNDGCEVLNIQTDSTHCGRCGNFCFFPNGSANCANGACALASCSNGFANCNNMPSDGCEIDTRTNIQHCGGCNVACAAGEQCLSGRCTLVCPSGQQNCNGRCADLRTDRANCGMCNRACGPGQVCSDNACTTSCGGGLTDCSGNCRDLQSDVNHCGACGRVCASGQRCNRGVCELSCPTGQTACGGTCVNLTNDAANCGACSRSCTGSFANSAPSCVGSACTLGTCNAGFGNCDNNNGNGCETNTNASTAHCGACGAACSFPNASATCTNGRCGLGTCNSGFGDCDGIDENGCETNLNTAVNHCSRCGNVCTTMISGLVPRCAAGVCGTMSGTCNVGTGDCDGNAGNGCETNTNTSLTHCGACGQGCSRANGMVSCTSGVCVLNACNSGFGNCDGDATNGCETNTNVSTTHCGGCGRPCFFANASPTCTAGSCALGACNMGFANCDMSASNGCEANLQSDRLNCGACGRQCSAGEVCSAGVCTLMCQTGQTNCSGSCVNTTTDRSNCGACGNVCAAGRICSGGTCVLSCPTGQTACGASCVNTLTDPNNCGPVGPASCGVLCTGGRVCSTGMCVCPAGQFLCGSTCVDRQTNAAHCGACNNACAAGQVCSNGTCVSTCQAGTVNCSGSCVNTLTDVNNCGPVQPSTCGMACTLPNAVNTCSGGTCGISSCNSPFANCNNMSADGCEVNISTSAANCGGCGNNCVSLPNVSTATCVSATCNITACTTNRGNCNSNPADGCETNFVNDATNCGMCGNNCNNLNQVATASCNSGACSIGACDSGFGNCDMMVGNGCETNTTNDAANCGACGAVCGATNTLNNSCLSGRCNCAAGFRDCNSSRTDGCEVSRLTDANNCGECGVVCSGATPNCVFGACRPTGCGGDGQPCCTGDLCNVGNACVTGNCTNMCGMSGQPCCNGSTCGAGLSCMAGTCG